jgi:DnaK suppressor protein
MFASILHMMGFPLGKPVHSRASSNQHGANSGVRDEGEGSNSPDLFENSGHGVDRDVQARANSARSQEVKAKTGTIKVIDKATKTPKAAAKAKPTAKAILQSKAKPPVKAGSAVKSAGKTAARSSGKAVVQEAPRAKVSAKATIPGKDGKRGVKVAPKAGLAVAVTPATKVKTKDSVKTTISKAVKPLATSPTDKVMPVLATVKPVLPVSLAPVSASLPVRAGRPSSRLAQLTVPSMAQSVASTAAKASFTQTMASPLIVPPLASAIKKNPKLANNWKSKSIEQLTDVELIAMPDVEYMNEFQMAFFRRRLVHLKKDILSNAGETTEHLREDTVVVPDPADRATIEEEHALELRTRDRERKLLKKIEQSIARIDAGDYGYCDETGEPIGVGRLLARPTANLSLEAQQRRELKQKMFGD